MSDDELYVEIHKPEGYVPSEQMLEALETLAVAMASEGSDEVSGFAMPGAMDFGLRAPGPSNIVFCGGGYERGGLDGAGPKCSGTYIKFP